MKFTIRKAATKDFKAVAAMNKELHEHEIDNFIDWFNPTWPESVHGQRFVKKHFNSKNKAVFVAEVKGKIAGYIFGGKTTNPVVQLRHRRYELANIYIREQYRDSGVGQSLWEVFYEWAKEQGAEKIKVTACTDNIKAIKFYKKNGFKNFICTLNLDVKENLDN